MSQLDEIKDRHAAIIPGPWRWYGNTETDQVSLATTNRGRLFIMDTHVRTTEYVHDYRTTETYELPVSRDDIRQRWCPAHAEWVDPDDTGQCQCDEIERFLSGTLEYTGESQHFDFEDRGYAVALVRGVQVHPDLRFPDNSLGDRRNEHGGMMRSYRDSRPKYEVLGYRSIAEWEMDQGGVVPNVDHDVRHFLYREDFTGFDHPEATFIEHSPEDVGYLLNRLEAAERLVEALSGLNVAAMKHPSSLDTYNSQRDVARARMAWEEAQ